MAHSRSYNTHALVIKRSNVGEADRIITLLTADQGKIAVVAKGVRQLKSSKGAYFEPGNLIKCALITTKSLPILTQATLIQDTLSVRTSLAHMRQLLQLLEIIDILFVEEQGEGELFQDVIRLRNAIVSKQGKASVIRDELARILSTLGYQEFTETKYETIGEYVAALADRSLKSWEYLKV